MSEPERRRDEVAGSQPSEQAPQVVPPEEVGAEEMTSDEVGAEEATSEEVGAEEATPEAAVPDDNAASDGRLRRIRSILGRIPHPTWRTRRGVLVLFLLFAGIGAAVAVSLQSTLHYSETASFCGSCHTMDPELKAYKISPHRDVACAECHVEPGLRGMIKAKANGTKQLIQILTDTYPKPIPPPSHAHLPSVTDTCLRCHALERITKNDGPVQLVLRPRYQPDEKNTREMVAVVLRPTGLGADDGGAARGVHWHIQQKVTYHSSDPAAKSMDLVEVEKPDGTVTQYIAASAVAVSADVQGDVTRIKKSGSSRVMDCLACHNRVGHAVPGIEQAVDESISAGRISAELPFIKRDSVALLDTDYPTLAAAEQAMDGLGASYQGKYPLIANEKRAEIAAASSELKRIYGLIATPEMKVQARTYPDNLGHQTSPGCFRCHDGAHYQVVGGKLTDKVIPSTCSTCHTFPQRGGSLAGIIIGGAPASHKDEPFVFNHKKLVSTVDPRQTSCAACHPPSSCENCHRSGAIKVKHDAMLYNHPASIRTSGAQACAACHQPVYCAQCHRDPVLPTSGK